MKSSMKLKGRWFKGPDWRPGGLRIEAPEVTRAAQRKHDPRLSRSLAPYVALNLVLAIAGTTYLMFTQGAWFGRLFALILDALLLFRALWQTTSPHL